MREFIGRGFGRPGGLDPLPPGGTPLLPGCGDGPGRDGGGVLMRLLPWTGEDGKACYLSTDGDGSYLSRLADNLEAVQLGMAEELLGFVRKTLAEDGPAETELRMVITRMSEALWDVLRVARSRGGRLPRPDDDAVSAAAEAAIDRPMRAGRANRAARAAHPGAVGRRGQASSCPP
jgi:hypothetical protein